MPLEPIPITRNLSTANPKTILVTETHNDDKDTIIKAIEKCHLYYEFAADFNTALHYTKQNHTDIAALIINYNNEQFTLDLLKEFRTSKQLCHIPIIGITDRSRKEYNHAITQGVYYILEKPFNADLLGYIMSSVVGVANYKRTLLAKNQLIKDSISMVKSIELQFQKPSDANLLSVFLADHLPDSDIHIICLFELLINAIEHGTLGIGYTAKRELLTQQHFDEEIERRLALPENKEKYAYIHFIKKGEAAEIIIEDCGDGFDFEKYFTFDEERLLSPNGRGIAIAAANMNAKLEYIGKGNIVKYTVALM